MKQKFLMVPWAAYLFILLKITVFRRGFFAGIYEDPQINLSLFSDLVLQPTCEEPLRFLYLLLGNILWFLPYGFCFPLIKKGSGILETTFQGFLFSLIIELSQFVFRCGVMELDDLLLNTLGVFVGSLLFRYFRFRFPL